MIHCNVTVLIFFYFGFYFFSISAMVFNFFLTFYKFTLGGESRLLAKAQTRMEKSLRRRKISRQLFKLNAYALEFFLSLFVSCINLFVNKAKPLNFEISICINSILYKYNVNNFVNNVNISFSNTIIYKHIILK